MNNYTDKRLNPKLLMPGLKSIVCVAMSYAPAKRIPEGQYQLASYAYGQDYHEVVKSKLRQLATHFGFEPHTEDTTLACSSCINAITMKKCPIAAEHATNALTSAPQRPWEHPKKQWANKPSCLMLNAVCRTKPLNTAETYSPKWLMPWATPFTDATNAKPFVRGMLTLWQQIS